MTTNYYGGTTILAAAFEGGVVIGADTRTSCRTYVSNRAADKLSPLTKHIYCCRSGSAAQTQRLADNVSSVLRKYEISMGEPARVRDAAVEFRNRIYTARKSVIASVIVAGWDKFEGGQVYSVPISGLLIREPCAVAGSGATYIHGYVSAHFRLGLDVEQTVELVKSSIQLAMHHDCSSGGVIRIGVIDREGIHTRVFCHEDSDVLKFTNNALWNLEFGVC